MLDRLQAMQRALEGRPHLARIGALFSETALLKVDGREFYLEFDRGRLARIAEAAHQIRAGHAGRALAHATQGHCLQQNFVCLLEGE